MAWLSVPCCWPSNAWRARTFSAATVSLHVVHAHDVRAALHRQQRRRHAGRQPLVDRQPGDGAQRRLARPARQQRIAGCQQFVLARQQREILLHRLAEADARVPGDARRRPRPRSRSAAGRSLQESHAPAARRRPPWASAAWSAARRACASGRRRSSGCAATASRAPGCRSAQMSLMMSAPRSSACAHDLRLVGVHGDRHAQRHGFAQHRQHPRQLFLQRHGRRARPARFAADVEDVRRPRPAASRSAPAPRGCWHSGRRPKRNPA